jgi:EF-P beta-lysylation protein EpmB
MIECLTYLTPTTMTDMAQNWQQALKQSLKGDNLKTLQELPAYSHAAGDLFMPVITEEMNRLIDWKDADDPLLLQFLPLSTELNQSQHATKDPVGDNQATVVPGLIHKYQGRVLLIASGSCAVNCRYCFRRHFPYEQSYAPRNSWRASVDYIAQQHDVHEVILSGGDPLTLRTQTLQDLSDKLEPLNHVKTIRIHSRIPVVLPSRINASLLNWAKSLSLKKVMVLHVNHPNELGEHAAQAITHLKQAGFILLNQSVLLKGINDSAKVLVDLSHRLFELDVLPYYLHLFDQVQNATHFDTGMTAALDIYHSMQQQLPGYLLPKLVKEEAGKRSKTLKGLNK